MDLVEKLEKWVNENPEEADLKTMNVTTGKETSIRDMLEVLKKEKETKVAIVDEAILTQKREIESWLEEV